MMQFAEEMTRGGMMGCIRAAAKYEQSHGVLSRDHHGHPHPVLEEEEEEEDRRRRSIPSPESMRAQQEQLRYFFLETIMRCSLLPRPKAKTFKWTWKCVLVPTAQQATH